MVDSGARGFESLVSADRGESDGESGERSGSAETADRGAWKQLLELDARVFTERKIRLLTPEARVLIYLKLTGSVSVTTAMQVAGTSYRGFYAVLERLKQAGLVAQVKDTEDQRVRKLSLKHSSALPAERP